MSIESDLLARVNELHGRIDSLAYRGKASGADAADMQRDDVHDELFMPMEDVRQYAAAVVQHISAQDAEIARLTAALTAPLAQGWVVVPREPTEAMVEAGDDAGRWSGGADGHIEAPLVWAAMLKAATPQPADNRGWRGIESAPNLFLGYEKGDFGPVIYGVVRGPFGDFKLLADPEFEVDPTHWMPLPAPPQTGVE